MTDTTQDPHTAIAPIFDVAENKLDARENELESGIGLCLSGGGYRAMIFHLGALWRLNETGYLSKLRRVSSVSGGSITAAMLGLKWNKLVFDDKGVAHNLQEEVIAPIREFAHHTIDVWAVLIGLLPFMSINGQIIKAYKKHLFGDSTLQDLPEAGPDFVINATNLQSGALVRLSRPYLADYKVGMIRHPTTPLATAVAASSAFPPILSPAVLKLHPDDFDPKIPAKFSGDAYRKRMVLSDGGVYDNMGTETVWKRYDTVLVSDAGLPFAVEPKPPRNWLCQTLRVLNLIDNQVLALRKRVLIGSYQAGTRKGCYWGIATNIANYRLPDPLPCPHAETEKLATLSTRLADMDDRTQEKLINWGYAVCDAALRKHLQPDPDFHPRFPCPGGV